MADRTYLRWPFLDDEHRALASDLDRWAAEHVGAPPDAGHDDVDGRCRELVRALGAGGWLRYAVPGAYGGAHEALDVRSLCLARETLAYRDALADFSFAMQGLGSGAISLYGAPALRERYLPGVGAGERIAAFALSEPQAGSDVAHIETTASADGDGYLLDGTKTWISNGGLADFYTVFARTGEAPGVRGLSAFVVDADAPGLRVAQRIEVLAPHPLATLELDGCRVGAQQRLGGPGEGFRVAMATLDVFRPTVGAAALGLARRALDEALGRVRERRLFGGLGVTVGHPAERLYREVRALRIYEGASEVQQLIIARAALAAHDDPGGAHG